MSPFPFLLPEIAGLPCGSRLRPMRNVRGSPFAAAFPYAPKSQYRINAPLSRR